MPKPKRKRGTFHGNQWTVPAPHVPRPDPVDLAALDAMAAAVAPRGLGLLRDRIEYDVRHPEDSEGARLWAEMGYELLPPDPDVKADDLIRAIAEEAVRAVKSRFAATAAPGPTADTIMAEAEREVARRPQRLSTTRALEAGARERLGSKRSDRPSWATRSTRPSPPRCHARRASGIGAGAFTARTPGRLWTLNGS
jgi:hypothetical protein